MLFGRKFKPYSKYMMNQKELKKLSTQLKRLHKALSNTLKEIEHTLQTLKPMSGTRRQSYPTSDNRTSSEDQDLLHKQWAEIKTKIENSPNPDSLIRDFVQSKSKEEIRQFIIANSLPINPKDSKEAIQKQLIQILRVTKIIRGI